jgi:DNA-binding PadR family transcriptional regulator
MVAKGKGKKTVVATKDIGKKAADRMFSLFILWLLSKKPAHGYELISILNKEHEFAKIGPSHIYPFLRKLSNMKLIRAKEEKTGQRVRKLYSITPLGKKKMQEIKKFLFGASIRAKFLREMIK